MMASKFGFGSFSLGRDIELKPQGRLCSPRNDSRPQGPVTKLRKGAYCKTAAR